MSIDTEHLYVKIEFKIVKISESNIRNSKPPTFNIEQCIFGIQISYSTEGVLISRMISEVLQPKTNLIEDVES